MMCLLVECIYVFEYFKVNFGIQWVVCNVICELLEVDEMVECILVVMFDGILYQVYSLVLLDLWLYLLLVCLCILVE